MVRSGNSDIVKNSKISLPRRERKIFILMKVNSVFIGQLSVISYQYQLGSKKI